MDSKDGRALARKNEIRVLRGLHRFGWLRTRDIAALVWQRWATKSSATEPDLQPLIPTASGLRMAQRTLKRLRETRQVLMASAPNGSIIYALAEAGVRTLQGIDIAASTGKDQIRRFSSAHFRHRCVANEITINAIVAGFRTSTEREISQGLWMGGNIGIAGKKPDALIRHSKTVWWVEVERSRKNARDYLNLLCWLDIVRSDAFAPTSPPLFGEKITLSKIIFICTPGFCSKLERDLIARGWKKNHLESLILFSSSLYSFESITFPRGRDGFG